MGLFSWLFRKPRPAVAVYVDRSDKGNYIARIVRADDPEIGRGKPTTLWVRPVQKRFGSAKSAVQDALASMRPICEPQDGMAVYVERAEGGVSTAVASYYRER